MVISDALKKQLEDFALKWSFRTYGIDHAGELEFFAPSPYSPNEPYCILEYKRDSEIFREWSALQTKIDIEWEEQVWNDAEHKS